MLVGESFGNFWDYWDLSLPSYGGHKVWFDGEQKVIQIVDGVTSIDVQEDLYSAWKEWVLLYDNAKWDSALRSVGGDPISDTESLGDTYFLTNGWRIRPWVGDYSLDIVGNLYVEGGGESVVTSPLDISNILTNLKTSVLVNRQIFETEVSANNESVVALLEQINENTSNTQNQVSQLPDQYTIRDEVWSKLVDELTDQNTIGGFIAKKLLSVVKFLSFK